jgi:hypothetical protein
MRLIYTVLCTDILTDRETGSTSYIKTIDKLVVSKLPVVIPSLGISTYWDVGDRLGKKIYLRFYLYNPDGKSILSSVIPPFTMSNDRQRFNLQIGGLKIESAGDYKFTVESKLRKNSKWEIQNDFILNVRIDSSIEHSETNIPKS